MNKIRNFFWLCSGANKDLLVKSPTEASKYAGIGATVFFTGIFASLAGYYALYTVFDLVLAAILVGLIWGTMIFNLDRYIVSSMRKKETLISELKMAAPRIILAILIAIVISKPLEMKVFEKEINSELIIMNLENQQIRENLVKSRYQGEMETLKVEISSLNNEVLDKTNSRDTLRRIAQKEADGTGGTMRRNAGPIYRIKKADADQVEKELEGMRAVNNTLIAEKQFRMATLSQNLQSKIVGMEASSLNGLAARMEALNRLTLSSNAIWVANWFILLLFIAIESAPVLVKLLSPKGSYDYELETVEYKSKADNLRERANINKLIKIKTKGMPVFEKEYIDKQLEIGLASGSKF